MMDTGPATRRLAKLADHMGDGGGSIALGPCSSVLRSLPQFDSNVMANYLDDLRSMKNEVYEV